MKNNNNPEDIIRISSYILNNRTLIFCRVSTIDQTGLQHISFELQETKGNVCASIFKLKVEMVYKIVESAYKNDYQTIKSLIKKFKGKNIIIYNVTRFCRNLKAGVELLNLALKNKTRLIFVEEGIVWDEDNQYNLLILKNKLAYAQEESLVIGRRVKDAISEKKRRGYHVGGTPKYGFKAINVEGGKKAVFDEQEQDVINFIKICKKVGTSVHEINKYMNLLTPDPIIYDDPIILYYNGNETDVIKEPLSNVDIAGLLNSYNVSRRGKKWNGPKVSSVNKREYDKMLLNLSEIKMK